MAHQHGVTESAHQPWQSDALVAEFVERTTARADDRRILFDFACDLVPFEPDAHIRVLDIGAGYGAFSAAVLERFPNATAIGLDLSEPMMAVGREHMARFGDRFAYHVGDFSRGELPVDLPGPFDAVVASASMFHLPSEAKPRIYAAVFEVLNPGGCFFNVEPVAPANKEMHAWYEEWSERERRRSADRQESPNQHASMVEHHFASAAHRQYHHIETEANQLALLRAAGFIRVDCFYKRLLETVSGGFKPSARRD
jgi:tRNA (cmo5U34)-methyltransferase